MPPQYDVFISHAGEDKEALAIPIYEELKRRGILAFLDQSELKVGGDAAQDMEDAMRTALIGLFILSPEFALKYYPMLELECFLRRLGLLGELAGGSDAVQPVLIPVFYRLTVAQCRYAEMFRTVEADETVRQRFAERVGRGETSADDVLKCLRVLSGRTGIENREGVTNEDTTEMSWRRDVLVREVCNEVSRVLMARARGFEPDVPRIWKGEDDEGLHATFHAPKNAPEVVLDFTWPQVEGDDLCYEAKVLGEVLRDDGTRVVAVLGGAGVGKSCILRGLAQLKDVRERFPGGVYFITLGMDASVDTLRSELLRLLRVSGGEGLAERLRDDKSVNSILNGVRKLLGRGRSLVVLDDVWDRNGLGEKTISEIVDTFSNEYGGVVLVSTRFASVAMTANRNVHVKPREPGSDEAKAILLRYAKCSPDAVDTEGLTGITEELLVLGGGIPVCLAVMGRGLLKLGTQLASRGATWKIYLDMIRTSREQIRDKVGNYPGLSTTLSVALLVLEGNQEELGQIGAIYSWQEMYRSLCVMKKQTLMPTCVLQRMWRVRSAGAVWKIVEGFASVGLCDMVCEGEGKTGLRIHDLLHEYAASLAQSAGEVREWHERLLDGYVGLGEAKDGVRMWWNVVGDLYIHDNICRHLRQSGCAEELVGLLVTVEWTLFRHMMGGLTAWERDISECMAAVAKSFATSEKDEVQNGLSLVWGAVVSSWVYVSINWRELGYQVFGRLAGRKEWPAQRYMESVEKWNPRPWLRPLSQCWGRPGEGGKSGDFELGVRVQHVVIHEHPFMAVASAGHEVVIVDLERMQVMRRLVGHSDDVMRAWVDCSGERILSWSRDGTVRQWNTSSGNCERVTILGRREKDEGEDACKFWCTSFSADGKLIVTGSGDGAVELWEVESGEKLGDAFGECGSGVTDVNVSPDGSRIVASWTDCTLRVWDLRRQQQVGDVLRGHEHWVTSVSISPEGKRAVSCDCKAMRLWDVEAGRQIGDPFYEWPPSVLCVSFNADGKWILAGCGDRTIRVLDAMSGAELFPLLRVNGCAVSVSASASGRYVVCGGNDATVRLWDLKARYNFQALAKHDFHVSCFALSPDGLFLVSGSRDKTLRTWDTATGMQRGDAFRGHEHWVECVAVSPDSQWFVSGSEDHTLRVWDVRSNLQVGRPLVGHESSVLCVAFSPSGRFIVSGSQDRRVRIWRTDNHIPVGTSGGFGTPIGWRHTALLPRKIGLLISSILRFTAESSTNAESDAPIDEGLEGHNGSSLTCVAVSANGQLVLCGFNDGKISAWDAMGGGRVGSLQGDHNVPITELEISQNNEVISVDTLGREILWKLNRKSGLVRDRGHDTSGENEVVEDPRASKAELRRPFAFFWRSVKMTASGVHVGTLPSPCTAWKAWQDDASHVYLGVGMEDGRVLICRLES